MATISDKAARATNEAEERGPLQPLDIKASLMENPIPMEVPSSKPRGLKGKKLVFPHPLLQTRLNLGGLLLEQQPIKISP
jgi:hypothetical protein